MGIGIHNFAWKFQEVQTSQSLATDLTCRRRASLNSVLLKHQYQLGGL